MSGTFFSQEFWVALLCLVLTAVIDITLQTKSCRDAQYNCDYCKYWPCPAHYCKRKREQREKNNLCVGCEYRPCTFEEFKKFCPKRNTDSLQDDVAGDVDCNT